MTKTHALAMEREREREKEQRPKGDVVRVAAPSTSAFAQIKRGHGD